MNRARRATSLALVAAAAAGSMAAATRPLPGEKLFLSETVPQVRIQIAPGELEQLRRGNRTYVHATVIFDTNRFENAGVRLKGHGSFQPLEAKPSLAVKFNEFVPGQKLDGLTKILLNNSSQDASLLSEYIAAGMFQEAGVPAARVTHARVQLNARDLGFYVLLEAMNHVFLKQHFKDADGHLYDANARDVDRGLTQSNGAPSDQSDVAALVAAARLPPGQRASALPAVLNVDGFLSFLAVSLLGAHHDSYPLNRNNYRLYHDPSSGRFVMMPSGIDGSFSRPSLSIRLQPKYVLTKAIAQTPEFDLAFRARVGLLFTNVLSVDKLTNRIHAAARRLQNATKDDPERASLSLRAAGFARRVTERHRSVAAQLAGVSLTPLQLSPGASLALTNWDTELTRGTAVFDTLRLEGRPALHIHTGAADSLASWRQRLVLAPGSYRFCANVRFASEGGDLAAAPRGVTLRISGRSVSPTLAPAGAWTQLEFRFAIPEGEEDVQFVCECRGWNAQAWFDLDSIELRKN
jgi:spore coat protein H